MFTAIIFVCSLKSMCIPSFVLIGYCVVSYMAIYAPIVMYGLKLFIVVLQKLPNCLHVWGNKGGEGEGEVDIIHMCI